MFILLSVRMFLGTIILLICGGIMTGVKETMAEDLLTSTLAEVKNYNGIPCLFIKGKPVSGVSYATHFPPREREIKDFASAGVHFFQFYQGDLDSFWKGPDNFDFSGIDRGYRELIKFDPEAVVIIRIGVNVPRWWAEKHPEEIATSYIGRILPWQSMASELWRKEAGDALARLVKHIITSDYGDHIIGYLTVFGEENTYPGCWWVDYTPYDYSKPMQRAFQDWLRERYQRDVAKLQQAWKDSTVTFETAQIPSRERRLQRDFLSLRDPGRGRQVIDYEICASEVCADAIVYLSKVIKDASGRKVVCGAFYGYVISSVMHFHDYGPQLQGHLALKKLLACPDIDFISTPANYRHRAPGETWSSQTLINSVSLNGKLFMSEDDVRTPLAADLCGRTSNPKELEAVLESIMGWRFSNASSGWWVNFSASPTYFDMPVIMAQVSRFNRLSEQMLQFNCQPKAEVAVFLDPESYLFLSPGISDSSNKLGKAYDVKRDPAYFSFCQSGLELFAKFISQQVVEELPHLGAPFHLYLLDDLSNPNLPEYKLYIFLSPIHLNENQKLAIEKRVKKDGKTVLWLYAAGFASDTQLSAERMSEIIGMKIKLNPFWVYDFGEKEREIEVPLQVRITEVEHPITQGLAPRVYFECQQLFGPVFTVDDPGVKVLGETIAGYYPFPRSPALAVKEMSRWKSVYSFAPLLPAELLRNIARYAGVHIYDDKGDFLSSSSWFLCIHSAFSGTRLLKLPKPTDVYSVTEGRYIGKNLMQFEVNLPSKTTRFYLLGKAAQWAEKNNPEPAIIQSERIPLTGKILDETLKKFLPGWKPENLKISPAKGPTPEEWGCEIETTGEAKGALRLETSIDWSNYEGLEIWFKRENPYSKLTFCIVDGEGKFYRWDIGEIGKSGEWNRIVLDTKGLAPGLSATNTGLFITSGTFKEKIPGKFVLGPVNLLTRVPEGVKSLAKTELSFLILREWIVLSPFDDSEHKGIDLELPPDNEIKLDVSYQGKNGKPIHWQPLKIDGNTISMPEETWCVAYFLTHIYAPRESDALLLVGSDDGIKIWLNGAQVWRNQVWRAVRPGEDMVPVKLKEGWNQLLCKINQGGGPWGLSVVVVGPDLEPLAGLKNSALPEGKILPEVTGFVPIKKEISQKEEREMKKFYEWAVLPLAAVITAMFTPETGIAMEKKAEVIYKSDFSSGKTEGLKFAGGAWKLENGELIQSNNTAHLISRAFISEKELTDFVLETRVKITGGQQKTFCVMFRADRINEPDEVEYTVSLIADTSRGLSISKRIEGKWKLIQEKEINFEIDRWYRIRLIVEGKRIKVAVDGVPQVDLEDDSLTKGLVGLTFYGATGSVSDLEVVIPR